MKLSYAHKKRIQSLATRYLHDYDGLNETKDLNDMYQSDFMQFAENLLVDLYSFEREKPKPIVHRPRKVGTRPPKRKAGERPPKIGEVIQPDSKSGLPTKHKATNIHIAQAASDQQPAWYKKAWRKVMMQVHPDRLDSVSKDDIDKLERLRIADRLRQDKSPELLIACSNKLDVEVELNVFEQERILRVESNKIKKEISYIQNGVPWQWGEAVVDNNFRLQIIKNVLRNSSIKPLEDSVLLDYILRNAN